MLQYERIDVSEGIGINKSDKSKECMICHHWNFKGIGYKYEPRVCNGCHDLSMMVYNLNDFMILNIKGLDYRCYVFNMSKNDAVKQLNNSVLDKKRSIIMDFGANMTPVEVIKKGAFGGTYFKDIYCNVNDKWYKNSWKKFDVLKDIDQKYYCSNHYDVSVNKYGVKCGT